MSDYSRDPMEVADQPFEDESGVVSAIARLLDHPSVDFYGLRQQLEYQGRVTLIAERGQGDWAPFTFRIEFSNLAG